MIVAGAGPAGSSAAIAAALTGADVTVYDKSRIPRHKVCGEFLSPEILDPLGKLGVISAITAAGPPRIERLRLRFRSVEKNARLPEPALGLSRFALDQILLERAQACGAVFQRGPAPTDARPLVLATGRSTGNGSAREKRLFGFKAHYQGPQSDAIELYFWGDAYVGINSIEAGRTNICGLAPEHLLRRFDFDYDALLGSFPPLAERVAPLARILDWHSTGPLVFGNRLDDEPGELVYPAGDALSFVDPFTGTGLATALITGRLAGIAAATSLAPSAYLAQCRKAIAAPYAASSLFRAALRTPLAEAAAAVLPSAWLVRLTRPRRAA